VLLAAVLGYSMSVDGQTAVRQPDPNFRAWLTFGQSVALTDFDGDSIIDQATLGGVGFSKSISVSLSTSKKQSVLRFTTASYNHGSLFAYDTNNDGDIDLVWTDLLNPDDVIVWLNDGAGQFQQVGSRAYADRFVVGASGIIRFSERSRELAACQSPRSAPDQAEAQAIVFRTAGLALVSRRDQCFGRNSFLTTTAGRAPPSIV